MCPNLPPSFHTSPLGEHRIHFRLIFLVFHFAKINRCICRVLFHYSLTQRSVLYIAFCFICFFALIRFYHYIIHSNFILKGQSSEKLNFSRFMKPTSGGTRKIHLFPDTFCLSYDLFFLFVISSYCYFSILALTGKKNIYLFIFWKYYCFLEAIPALFRQVDDMFNGCLE